MNKLKLARKGFFCLCPELSPDTSDIIVVVQMFLLWSRVAKTLLIYI